MPKYSKLGTPKMMILKENTFQSPIRFQRAQNQPYIFIFDEVIDKCRSKCPYLKSMIFSEIEDKRCLSPKIICIDLYCHKKYPNKISEHIFKILTYIHKKYAKLIFYDILV